MDIAICGELHSSQQPRAAKTARVRAPRAPLLELTDDDAPMTRAQAAQIIANQDKILANQDKMLSFQQRVVIQEAGPGGVAIVSPDRPRVVQSLSAGKSRLTISKYFISNFDWGYCTLNDPQPNHLTGGRMTCHPQLNTASICFHSICMTFTI